MCEEFLSIVHAMGDLKLNWFYNPLKVLSDFCETQEEKEYVKRTIRNIGKPSGFERLPVESYKLFEHIPADRVLFTDDSYACRPDHTVHISALIGILVENLRARKIGDVKKVRWIVKNTIHRKCRTSLERALVFSLPWLP